MSFSKHCAANFKRCYEKNKIEKALIISVILAVREHTYTSKEQLVRFFIIELLRGCKLSKTGD